MSFGVGDLLNLFGAYYIWFITIVGIVIAVYIVLGFAVTSQAIGDHQEWRKSVASPQEYGLRADLVTFRSRDGILLKGWWLPATMACRSVILAHGSGGNRSHMLSRAAFLVKNGYNVLAVDLRAHGESQGNYMTPGYLEALDILGALDDLKQSGQQGPVALLGYSYGGVAALHAASKSPLITAVIADSAFISSADMMSRLMQTFAKNSKTPWWAKLLFRLANIPLSDHAAKLIFYLRTGVYFSIEEASSLTAIANIKRQPILFLTGENDLIAPPSNTRKMYELAPTQQKTLVILKGATHQTYATSPRQYESAVLDFLKRVL